MGYFEDINNLIEERLKYYQTNTKEIARDYTIEKSTKEEYDGRQLLEMLQNVDDTGSPKVKIEWDKNAKKLAISNYGEAFSVNGIESLMRSHSSPKNKEDFIGNKGLGFRSLLIWASRIDIFANDCKISFSQNIAESVFNDKLSLSAEAKNVVKKQSKVLVNVIPFPVLAIPELIEFKRQDDWQTVIEIHYIDDVEDKIQEIFDQISEELLLFLNNIEQIELVVDKDITTFKSTKTPKIDWTEVRINDKVWRVFSKDGLIPQKTKNGDESINKKYSLKVAFQNDLSDKYYKLFNFFPTKISVSLPCIIHGTFDLNASRDYINPSDSNAIIFKDLAVFLGLCAVLMSKEDVSWKPYQLINPLNESSDSSLVQALYKDLKIIREKERIIPTVNNDYIDYYQAKYYDKEFNTFFKDNFPDVLPELILPIENTQIFFFISKHYDNLTLVYRLDLLSNTEITIEQRAELIYQLITSGRNIYNEERFSLLINNKEDKSVISKDTVAFTPMVKSDGEFRIPTSIKIDFINTDLYNLLYKKLSTQFDSKNQTSREFQNAVKTVVNVQPYDSNSIILRVVSGINKGLSESKSLPEDFVLIKEMVSSLFANFKHLKTQQTKITDISLINKNNQIIPASDLFLGKTYPDGETVEFLYEGIYTKNDYLLEIDYWGLANENHDEVERFFLWLGVNKYAKISTKKLDGNWAEAPYFNYIFGINNPAKNLNFKIDRITKDTYVSYIENIEAVLQMDETKKLLLIFKDEIVRNKIEELETKILWRFAQSPYTIKTSISYIKYQFLKEDIFNSYVLEDGNEVLQKIINENINIDFFTLQSYGITTLEVSSLLLKLGAKQTVESLEPDVLYRAIRKVAEKISIEKTRGVQGVYKKIVDSLEIQDSKINNIPNDLKLFAKQEGKAVLLSASDIFYSNNSVLPSKIERTIPLLDFPKRGGQDKVHKYFGVNIVDATKIILEDVKEADLLNRKFQKLFESLRVSLLLYRLYSKNLKKEISTKEAIKQNVSYLKNCTIKLVDSCKYSYLNENKIALEDFEFVIYKEAFYIKVPSHNDFKALISASKFSDAFAEIMSIQFNVTELKNDFRFLIRNDLKDTLHLLTQDFDEEKINKVKNYFGVPAAEQNFWKNIYLIKGLEFPIEITKQKDFIIQISSDLQIELPSEYHKFNFEECLNSETYKLLGHLVKSLGVSLRVIYPQGIAPYNNERLRNLRQSRETKVKLLIWEYLNKYPEQQSNFLKYLDGFKLVNPQIYFEEEDKYKLNLDYEEIFKKFIERELPILMSNDYHRERQIVNHYPHFDSAHDFEFDDLKSETKSLFYFEGNNDVLKSFLDKNFPNAIVNPDVQDSDKNDDQDEDTLLIVDSSLTKITTSKGANRPSFNGKGKKRMTHSKRLDDFKNISGKNAEEKVYRAYQKQYGKDKVHWVSRYSNTPDRNDNLQYDLTYEDEYKIWKMVEVKSLSNTNSFFLSEAEKEHGIKNNSIYEFALVTNTTIHKIKSPFTFEIGDSFESNESFTARAKDYQLHFKLNTK